MSFNTLLKLEGSGQLINIYEKQGKTIAHIHVLLDSSSEEVNLEVELEDAMLECFFNLLFEVKKGRNVILTFKASYDSLKSGTSWWPVDDYGNEIPGDDLHILYLRCREIEVIQCSIDGSDDKHDVQLMAA